MRLIASGRERGEREGETKEKKTQEEDGKKRSTQEKMNVENIMCTTYKLDGSEGVGEEREKKKKTRYKDKKGKKGEAGFRAQEISSSLRLSSR